MMTPGQLKQSIQVRYANAAVMGFYAWGLDIPGNRTGMIACTAVALTANLVCHVIAISTGRYRDMVYALFCMDLVTVIPAIFFTGMASSPFLLVLLPMLYTVYFVEFNKAFTLRYGIACLVLWSVAYGVWWYLDLPVLAWNPSRYVIFSALVFLVQGTALASAIYASTYLPDPLLRARELQEAELERQHHRAELGVSMAMVVHELRNPLTTIGMGLEIARGRLEREQGAGSGVAVASVDRASGEVERVRRMLENLLAYARDRRGVMVRTEVDLREVVARAVEFAQLKYGRNRIRFSVSGQLAVMTVQGDRDGLYQVVVNLIDNAVSAEVKDRALQITLLMSSSAGAHEIVIQDNGGGIPPDLLERIFEPFTTRHAHGTGLGLPIVQRIVKDHGGTITLASTVGIGTTIRLQFPIPGLELLPAPERTPAPADPAGS